MFQQQLIWMEGYTRQSLIYRMLFTKGEKGFSPLMSTPTFCRDMAFMRVSSLICLYASMHIGMKTERKRTELSGATFVFIFLCGSRNEYRNTENKYENGYFRKQTWNKYSVNTDEKRMIIGTKRPPKSCRKT
jgi:hypothetical protein